MGRWTENGAGLPVVPGLPAALLVGLVLPELPEADPPLVMLLKPVTQSEKRAEPRSSSACSGEESP